MVESLLPRLVTGSLVALLASACGGDDGGGGGGGGTCSSIPACYTDAVTALRACVPDPALTLGTGTMTSGTVSGLTCSSASTGVAFSTFSASPTGTVPVPSTVTLSSGGAFCGELKSGTGSMTDAQGNTRTFTLSSFRAGAGTEIEVHRFEDGSYIINCSPPSSRDEVTVAAGALDACPGAVVMHEVTRNADYSQMGVDLIDASDARSNLLTCQ